MFTLVQLAPPAGKPAEATDCAAAVVDASVGIIQFPAGF